MAQYAILIYAHDSAHAPDATAQDTQACDDHSDDLAASGVMLAAYALTPREMATSVRADAITDGPFVDSKEVVAGSYVIEAPDLDAALAIARTNPVVRDGGGVEVRPVHSSFLTGPEPPPRDQRQQSEHRCGRERRRQRERGPGRRPPGRLTRSVPEAGHG